MSGKEADKKFFALRNSGYRGPIDQNGNKVASGKEAQALLAKQRDGKK